MAREKFQTLSEPMYYILLSLTKACCGVDIMKKVLEISNNRVLVGPGTLYALLAKFEKAGIINAIETEGTRKTYIISDYGKRLIKEEYSRLMTMVSEGKCFVGVIGGEEK